MSWTCCDVSDERKAVQTLEDPVCSGLLSCKALSILLSSRLEMGTTTFRKCRAWRWGMVATPTGQQALAKQSQSRPWDKLWHGR